jgi:CheY-specific phosphatase CheX
MIAPGITEETVATINHEFWSSMTAIQLDLVESLPVSQDRSEGISGHIEIQGGWRGSVEVRVSRGLARDAAASMICKPPEEISIEDCFDAVQEATNIIAGNIKRLLPPICKMNVPAMSGCSNLATATHGDPDVMQVHFLNNDYQLTILIRNALAA